MSNPSGYLADLYKLDGKVAVVIGGTGIVIMSAPMWLLGFVMVFLGLAYYGVNQFFGE